MRSKTNQLTEKSKPLTAEYVRISKYFTAERHVIKR